MKTPNAIAYVRELDDQKHYLALVEYLDGRDAYKAIGETMKEAVDNLQKVIEWRKN